MDIRPNGRINLRSYRVVGHSGVLYFFKSGILADLSVNRHESLARCFKDKLLGKNKMSVSDKCFVFFKELYEGHPNIREVVVG